MIRLPTFSGKLVDVLDPNQKDIVVEDIARSHAACPRYLGHSIRPYSIAEHSVRMAVAVTGIHHDHSLATCREVLLHDAHEAYLGEIPRMIKHADFMLGYREVEDRMDQVIRRRFGLAEHIPPFVKAIDRAICRAEINSGLFPHRWKDGDTGADNGDPALSKLIIAAMGDKGPSSMLAQWGWDYTTAFNIFMLAWDRGTGVL